MALSSSREGGTDSSKRASPALIRDPIGSYSMNVIWTARAFQVSQMGDVMFPNKVRFYLNERAADAGTQSQRLDTLTRLPA